MTNRDDYMVDTPDDFRFEGPSEDVLRQTIEHSNGDLTLRGPGGEFRLTMDTPTWSRYRRLLDALDGEGRTCEGYQPWDTLSDEERAEYEDLDPDA